jgi:phosphoribosylaminoimidazole-succinocarboxamide synthase
MKAARSVDTSVNSRISVWQTDLPLPDRRQGKVRDVYSVPPSPGAEPRVLIVASDRVSAFDVVLPTPLSGKGRLLTGISAKWFDFIRQHDIIPDHLVSTDPEDVPGLSAKDRATLDGRMMLGRAAKVIPIEFVVRGYLAGSGWKEYGRSGTVCGIPLPAGLQQCERLPEPIFTPATKAETGHDENIDFETACEIAGRDVMERLREVSLRIYREGAAHAESRGIILADTKFEFGYALDADGATTSEVILIDEVLTPDSSRFWPAEEYAAGRDQNSFDKQHIRNYLQGLVDAGRWDKKPPGPELPDEVVQRTVNRYAEAQQRLFGAAQG